MARAQDGPRRSKTRRVQRRTRARVQTGQSLETDWSTRASESIEGLKKKKIKGPKVPTGPGTLGGGAAGLRASGGGIGKLSSACCWTRVIFLIPLF